MGSGGWRDPNWTVALHRLDVRNLLSTDWLLSGDEVRLTVAQTDIELQRACWHAFEGSVCLAGHWKRDMGWRADLDVDALSVSSLGELWRPDLSWRGLVSGRARLNADADNVMSVTAHLGSSEGSATLVTDEALTSLTRGARTSWSI